MISVSCINIQRSRPAGPAPMSYVLDYQYFTMDYNNDIIAAAHFLCSVFFVNDSTTPELDRDSSSNDLWVNRATAFAAQ